jgi:glycosyltransferase involved in cell wall biosynthesis
VKLLYLANARLPSEKAHASQVVQMCAALAAAGVELELIHPRRVNYPEFQGIEDIWTYYGVPRNFRRRQAGSIELFEVMDRFGWRGRGFQVAFALQLGGYTAALVPRLLRAGADVYYTREITTLALLNAIRPGSRARHFYEAHTFPGSRAGLALHRAALARAGGVIAISQGLADDYRALGVPASRMCVAPDAVDPSRFGGCTRAEARHRLGWPADQPAVVYTGHFYAWKGVDTLVEAMRGSPAHLYLVGGIPEMITAMRARLAAEPNMHVVGWAPPAQVPLYLAAADVLALPNSGREAISSRYTSPLKLFEYMAAERPIVASDLPALREVLTDGANALLVPADNAAALRQAVDRLLANPALAARLARQARLDVAGHTWEQRARNVLAFVHARLAAAGSAAGRVVESAQRRRGQGG